MPKRSADLHASENYRPISLLSSLSKVYKHALVNPLKELYNSHDLFTLEQCGIRAGHFTQPQIWRVTELIHVGVGKGGVTGIVFLDVRKAFGKVWHVALI